MRECKKCGEDLPPQGMGRPRELCDGCKPQGRIRAVRSDEPAAPLVALHVATGPTVPERGALAARVSDELTRAGRLDTIAGQAALVLARKAESVAATASQSASAVRQLQATLDTALAGASAVVDPLGELKKRRALRASGQ